MVFTKKKIKIKIIINFIYDIKLKFNLFISLIYVIFFFFSFIL